MANYTRPVSIKSLIAVSQSILSYIDLYGCCTAYNASIAAKAHVGLATARACVTWLIEAGAFDVEYNWDERMILKTVRTLTLPARDNKWRGSKIEGRWVRDPFD